MANYLEVESKNVQFEALNTGDSLKIIRENMIDLPTGVRGKAPGCPTMSFRGAHLANFEIPTVAVHQCIHENKII